MEISTINSENNVDLQKYLEEFHNSIGEFAKEVAEREFELLEFNLFLSASGKQHLNKAVKSVQEIREMEKKGKINLKKYEDLTNEY